MITALTRTVSRNSTTQRDVTATGRVPFDVTSLLADKVALYPYGKFELTREIVSSPYHRPGAREEMVDFVPRLDLIPTPPSHGPGRASQVVDGSLDGTGLEQLADAANRALLCQLDSWLDEHVGRPSRALFPPAFFVGPYSRPTRLLSWYSRLQSIADTIAVTEATRPARPSER